MCPTPSSLPQTRSAAACVLHMLLAGCYSVWQGLPCTPLWVLGRLKAAYLCQHVECAALDMRSVFYCSFRCCTACGISVSVIRITLSMMIPYWQLQFILNTHA